MALVFILAVGFLLYQRHQYSVVMQENIDLVWENVTLKADLQWSATRLEACVDGGQGAEDASQSN